MIITLELIGYLAIFFALLNVLNLKKNNILNPVMNNVGYLILSLSLGIAYFFYIDDMGLNGNYIHSIQIGVQTLILVVTFVKAYLIEKKQQ